MKTAPNLVPPGLTAAKLRRRLHGAFPDQDAVLVVGCVILGISGGDRIGETRRTASVRHAGLTEGNHDILRGAVWTTDGHRNRGLDRVQGSSEGEPLCRFRRLRGNVDLC